LSRNVHGKILHRVEIKEWNISLKLVL
jgi:hypothetical protein